MAFAMTDKLGALKQRGSEYRPADAVPSSHDADQGEAGSVDDLNQVLHSADDINRSIAEIAKHIERIKHNHATILTTFQNQTCRDDNERLNTEIKKLSHKVHGQLKKMKSSLDSEETGPNRNSADFRIKKAQYSTLTRKFKDVMEEYNNVQEKYREKNKERIQKQLQYAGKNLSEDQVEAMIESDDPQIFTQDIMLETAQKRAALGEVEARHLEIIKLEANIRELHDMFYDMALLVEEQGELINLIERNVENASIYVYHGQKKITRAVVIHRSNTRKKWLICCILTSCCTVILIVAAIVAGVAAYFVLNRGGES